MATWTWIILFVLPTIALMVISEDHSRPKDGVASLAYARDRGRSVRAWVWIAAITGPLPLGPLALYLLGERKQLQPC